MTLCHTTCQQCRNVCRLRMPSWINHNPKAHTGDTMQSEPCFACLFQDNMEETHRQPYPPWRPNMYVCMYIREHTHTRKRQADGKALNRRRRLCNARSYSKPALLYRRPYLAGTTLDVCGRPIRATTPCNIIIWYLIIERLVPRGGPLNHAGELIVAPR